MPENDQKTVFISYRRSASRYIARAIFEHLRAQGYDAFLDIEAIDAGDFERIILGQIKARTHFLIILNRESIKRFEESGDWLRREIEFAIDQQRNIIPIMVDEFKFDTKTKKYLTGKLEQLPKFNGLHLPYDFFDAAMERLRERYLKLPVYVEVIPPPIGDIAAVERAVAEVAAELKPTREQLSAEEYFNRAFEKYEAKDYSGAIADYDKAIELDPQNAFAYYNRGTARKDKGDMDGAIADFNRAIELDPQDIFIYCLRGIVRKDKGDMDGAIADFNRAIELDPQNAFAYINRSKAYIRRLNFIAGVRDFAKVLMLESASPQNLAGLVIAVIILIVSLIILVTRLITLSG